MNSRSVELAIDVKCRWDTYAPSYRIYIDDELLTERSYIWHNSEAYIRENILVNLAPGEHTLILEKCGEKWVWGEFSLENFTIDGSRAILLNNHFTIAE